MARLEDCDELIHTRVVVHAAHNRSLEADLDRLVAKLAAQPNRADRQVELRETTTCQACKVKLAALFPTAATLTGAFKRQQLAPE